MSNLSKMKREEMLRFLEKLREEHNDDASIIAINEIENALTEKKYGLVWEEHEERVDRELETKIPVFTEIEEKEIIMDDEMPYNFLIEGDNLHCLYLLEKTHKGKIDVIYIDPPYNTQNSLTYDDKKISMDDEYRHSKWLSFMNNRLRLAKELLSDDGLLFISIDDNEQSQLKLLTDEIFYDLNFVITLPRQTKKSGKTTGSFSKNHDYVLVYLKKNYDVFKMQEHIDENYKHEDQYVKERGKYKLNQTLDYNSLSYSPSLDYPIEIDGKIFYPGGSYEKYKLRKEGKHKRADWAWRWNPKLFNFGYENGFIVVNTKSDGTSRIYTKTYLNAVISQEKKTGEYYIDYKRKTKPLSSLEFTENTYSNDRAKKDLAMFKLDDKFDYSKPVELIKELVKCHKNLDATILDFFAGSGTTGQAVLELNKEDGGNRRFILCTNNENNICDEVTYPRIKKVIEGYPFKGKKETILFEKKLKQTDLRKIDELWEKIDNVKNENEDKYDKIRTSFTNGTYSVFGIKEYDGKTEEHNVNLKYYKTDFIDRYGDEELYLSDGLMNHIKEMVQLENHIKIDDEKYIILFEEQDLCKLINDKKRLDNCKKLYKPSYLFLDTEQNKKVTDRGIEIITIPEYYFVNELREVGEL